MNNEYEFIIHRHSLESRFNFETCKMIVLSENDFLELIQNYTGNNSFIIKKLEELLKTSHLRGVRTGGNYSILGATRASSDLIDASEPSPATLTLVPDERAS